MRGHSAVGKELFVFDYGLVQVAFVERLQDVLLFEIAVAVGAVVGRRSWIWGRRRLPVGSWGSVFSIDWWVAALNAINNIGGRPQWYQDVNIGTAE